MLIFLAWLPLSPASFLTLPALPSIPHLQPEPSSYQVKSYQVTPPLKTIVISHGAGAKPKFKSWPLLTLPALLLTSALVSQPVPPPRKLF